MWNARQFFVIWGMIDQSADSNGSYVGLVYFSIFFCGVNLNDSQAHAYSTDGFLNKLLIYLNPVFLTLLSTVNIFEFKTLTRTMSVDSWKFPIAARDKFSQWHFRSVAESVLWWHVTVNPWANIPWKLYFQEQYFFLTFISLDCLQQWLTQLPISKLNSNEAEVKDTQLNLFACQCWISLTAVVQAYCLTVFIAPILYFRADQTLKPSGKNPVLSLSTK